MSLLDYVAISRYWFVKEKNDFSIKASKTGNIAIKNLVEKR
jgi:hypothetical protein